MSKFAEKVKVWYEAGVWTLEMVKNAVKKKKLTKAEYQDITGEKYEA